MGGWAGVRWRCGCTPLCACCVAHAEGLQVVRLGRYTPSRQAVWTYVGGWLLREQHWVALVVPLLSLPQRDMHHIPPTLNRAIRGCKALSSPGARCLDSVHHFACFTRSPQGPRPPARER